MANRDVKIKAALETCMRLESVGLGLKAYFETLADKEIRRSITVLSTIYPDQAVVSDEELTFIVYMLSTEKMIVQQSYHAFIRSIGYIKYTDHQKSILIAIIKQNLEPLSKACTFELDHLMMELFGPQELIRYLEMLVHHGGREVLEHILDTLRYEDFSDTAISDLTLQTLRENAWTRLQRIDDISLLVPKDKFDTSGIPSLRSVPIGSAEPILGALLGWIQDINWPVAQELIHVLPRFHFLLVPHIRAVFDSDDHIWKCWVLLMMEEFPRETVLLLSQEIKRLADSPTEGEASEDADTYAREIVTRFDL